MSKPNFETANNIYRGNLLIKKTGVKIDWTPEMIDEYMKCSDSPEYFIRTYCKIVSEKGLHLFDPYEYQIRMLDAFATNRYIVNLLPRQMGKTTVVAGYLLHYVLFNSYKTVGILANKLSTAREILSRIQTMYENLPFWLQAGVTEWNKGNITLGNGSKIIAAATSASSVRGLTLNIVYLDEFAHVEGQEEFWESTYPVISAGTESKVIITSTPKGLDLFYKLFTDAENNRNNFYPLRVHWNEHPDRDDAWAEDKIKNTSYEQFQQEFGCEFLGSSGTLITGATLNTLVYKDAIHESDKLKQYVAPVADRSYAIICDVSRGKGLDHSAFSVIDITEMPYNQVCIFRSNIISPVEYAEVINRIARHYNQASVLVEINDLGEQVAYTLYNDYEYENVMHTESRGRSGIAISYGKRNSSIGIRTTKPVKAIGCSVLKLLIEQNHLIINDFHTINELSKFSKKANSYSAEAGSTDDLVMGLVLFAWLSTQEYFKELTNINTIRELRENTQEELNAMMSAFYYSDGNENYISDKVVEAHDLDNWLL